MIFSSNFKQFVVDKQHRKNENHTKCKKTSLIRDDKVVCRHRYHSCFKNYQEGKKNEKLPFRHGCSMKDRMMGRQITIKIQAYGKTWTGLKSPD